MAILCPGADRFSQIFGVGRNGPNAFIAFLRAQDCDGDCEKIITGPDFSRFTVRLSPRRGGGWSCVIGGDLQARIDCVQTAVEADDEHAMRELHSYLRGEEQEAK
jgi:hypothetical protein